MMTAIKITESSQTFVFLKLLFVTNQQPEKVQIADNVPEIRGIKHLL